MYRGFWEQGVRKGYGMEFWSHKYDIWKSPTPPCRLRYEYLQKDDKKRHPYTIGQFARDCKHVGVATLRNGEICRGVWCGAEIRIYSVRRELPDGMAILKYLVPPCDMRATRSHDNETENFVNRDCSFGSGQWRRSRWYGTAQQNKSPPSVTPQKGPETIVTPTLLSGFTANDTLQGTLITLLSENRPNQEKDNDDYAVASTRTQSDSPKDDTRTNDTEKDQPRDQDLLSGVTLTKTARKLMEDYEPEDRKRLKNNKNVLHCLGLCGLVDDE